MLKPNMWGVGRVLEGSLGRARLTYEAEGLSHIDLCQCDSFSIHSLITSECTLYHIYGL